MPVFLDPTAPIAADAIVCDDPKCAMELAISMCESPRMSNLAFGLWGYHGIRPDGRAITVQSLGIGGPSAAAVVGDLASLGVRRCVRIGSCTAPRPGLDAGTWVVCDPIEGRDGTSHAIGGGPFEPTPWLTRALAESAGRTPVPVGSVDTLEGTVRAPAGGVADLSSAGFAAAAARHGLEYACALVVAGDATGESLGRDGLEEALVELGSVAGEALGQPVQAS
jgi:hypothetical protein